MDNENRIPRVRIHEDNFAEEIKNPSYPEECFDNYEREPKDYFIEVVNAKDEVIALFFIVDGYDRGLEDFSNQTNWEDFVSRFDWWLEPNRQWRDIELLRWLPNVLEAWRLNQLLIDVGISDVNELEWDSIPDNWRDYIIRGISADSYGPERSDEPALFLMAYGRLRYPYKLTNEIRENCILYIRGFVERRSLISGLNRISDDLKDIGELFNFCVDLFPDKESFMRAYINKNSIKELALYYPKTFMTLADSILCKENIDRFLDEAHAENNAELKLFLLDYKNKHFPVDGDSL